MKRALAILVLAAAAGCSSPQAPAATGGHPPGLDPKPPELAFECVTPGCDTTVTDTITVVGSRRVAIKRVIIQGPSDGFTLTPSSQPPFIVGAGSSFSVDVRYAPQDAPDPGDVELAIDYTDASPDESPDRLPPGRLLVPLVRRLVGEPVLSATPGALSFGVVGTLRTKTLPVQLKNVGFGNVSLEISAVDAGSPALSSTLDVAALPPDGGATLQVTYAPTSEGYLHSQITITSSTPDVAPVSIPVEGTSIQTSHIAVDPATPLDFGQVPIGQSKTLTRDVVNEGGQPLRVVSATASDPSGRVSVVFGDDAGGAVLAPLERVPLQVTLDGNDAGDLSGQVVILSDDPNQTELDLPVTGTVTEPQVTLTPASVDFGSVPVGWVVHQPLEVRNTGYGPLTVKNIQLVAGSSNLFSLNQVPGLPLTLQRDQRFGLDIGFSAATAAPFTAQLSVETDDPVNPFAIVPLTATGGACDASCPIAHGTPTCESGSCAIASCDTGWYDTDQNASNGCECQELPGGDPGAFCDSAVYLGDLKDTDADHATFTGILPVPGDVDLLRFYGEDATDWFSGDSYDVRITLSSADPNIKMCVYHYGTGSHQTSCEFTDESCPQDNSYEQTGSALSSDGADYIVKVYRTDGAAPTCTPYTVFMSNG